MANKPERETSSATPSASTLFGVAHVDISHTYADRLDDILPTTMDVKLQKRLCLRGISIHQCGGDCLMFGFSFFPPLIALYRTDKMYTVVDIVEESYEALVSA